MSKKKSSFEFAIVLMTSVLKKLQEYSDAEDEEQPEAIETTEIDYIPPPPPAIPPPDRPDPYEDDIVYPDPKVDIGLTEF